MLGRQVRGRDARWFAVTLAVISLAGPAAEADEADVGVLFRTPEGAAGGFSGQLGVVRERSAEVQFDVLRGAAVGSRVRLNLFEDADFLAVLEQREDPDPVRTGWVGRLVEPASGSLTLVYGEGVLIASVREGEHLYQVRVGGPYGHWLQEVDGSQMPTCGVGPEHHVSEPASEFSGPTGPLGPDDDGGTFDIAVFFTSAARNRAGGNPAINALVDLAIIETNQSYANSEVNSRVRLVYKGHVPYDEASGSFSNHLSRLRSTSDGRMDTVHAIRSATGADMVALLVADNQYCGIAYLMTSLSDGFKTSAFSVTNWSCATGYYSFGHELGHNQGCTHDRDNASGGLYQYSFGYRFNGQSGKLYRTVMSYSPGTRITQFSNPNVLFDGTPTGIASGSDSADNARGLNNASLVISRWYDTVMPYNSLLYSVRAPGTVGGLTLTDGDVASLDLSSGVHSMFVDLSDVVATDPDLDALADLGDGTLLMSFAQDSTIPGLNGGPEGETVRDEDLVRFIPTQLGDTTAGSFDFYFDGTDVAAGDGGGEDLDAVSLDGSGNLLLSFRGSYDVGGGLIGKDEDVLVFTPTSLGANTAGSWSLLFDGSDKEVKLGQTAENVDSIHFSAATGTLSVTTRGEFLVPKALKGFGNDVLTFLPTSFGANTAGQWMCAFEGLSWGFTDTQNMDAMHVVE